MIPAMVQWELTERCNYRCQHCYLIDSSGECSSAREVADDDLWRIAQRIADHQLFFTTLTGGEPLVRKDMAIRLSKYLSERGVLVSLNTNLVLMDEATLSALRLHGMLISCPSAVPERYRVITGSGRYARFEDNLRLVAESGIGFIVNMVVSRLNRTDVRLTAERMRDLGATKFAATPASVNPVAPRFDLILTLAEFTEVLNDLIWIHEELGMEVDVMEALPKCAIPERAFELQLPFVGRTCSAGRRNGTISPMGDIRPCGHNPNTFGNVLTEPMEEIWKRLQSWRGALDNPHHSCLACDAFSACHGNCAFGGHPVDPGRLNSQAFAEITANDRPKPRTPILRSDTVVRPCRTLLSRAEGEGWLVCSGSSRNLLDVNEAMYSFLAQTQDFPRLSLGELAGRCGTTFENAEFQRVVSTLMAKGFFIPAREDVEGRIAVAS